MLDRNTGQKAPSAKRCIKTTTIRSLEPKGTVVRKPPGLPPTRLPVRKHRAPKGALRRVNRCGKKYDLDVRKHRAPKGALRPSPSQPSTFASWMSQKAPSGKRCIKTFLLACLNPVNLHKVRKHRAPKGALRLISALVSAGILAVRKHRAPKGALRLREIFELKELALPGSESTEHPKFRT